MTYSPKLMWSTFSDWLYLSGYHSVSSTDKTYHKRDAPGMTNEIKTRSLGQKTFEDLCFNKDALHSERVCLSQWWKCWAFGVFWLRFYQMNNRSNMDEKEQVLSEFWSLSTWAADREVLLKKILWDWARISRWKQTNRKYGKRRTATQARHKSGFLLGRNWLEKTFSNQETSVLTRYFGLEWISVRFFYWLLRQPSSPSQGTTFSSFGSKKNIVQTSDSVQSWITCRTSSSMCRK